MTPHPDDPSTGAASRIRLVHADVPADAGGVRFLRTAVHTWLQRHFTLGQDRLSDMTLATNEALANAAEHAYPTPDVGTIALHAVYDDAQDEVTVVVTDAGQWHTPVPDPLSLRGRGLPLIHALAHRVSIDTSSHGTRIAMGWSHFRSDVY